MVTSVRDMVLAGRMLARRRGVGRYFVVSQGFGCGDSVGRNRGQDAASSYQLMKGFPCPSWH